MLEWIVDSLNSNNNIEDFENEVLFLESLFSMLAKMAKANGVVIQDEINAITVFMDTIELDDEDKKISINAFRSAVSDQYSIYEYANQYREIASQEMREIAYAILWEVAYSDNIIQQQEDEILRNIPEYLGLHNNAYHECSDNFLGSNSRVSGTESYYELLGCTKNSSDKEIKRSYRKVIGAYHPDKIQPKGLPKEFMDFANQQSKKINKAYSETFA